MGRGFEERERERKRESESGDDEDGSDMFCCGGCVRVRGGEMVKSGESCAQQALQSRGEERRGEEALRKERRKAEKEEWDPNYITNGKASV